MTDIGRMTQGPASAVAPVSWGARFDAQIDAMFDALMKALCRASRGYLCPPDMTSVMYPTAPPRKECCDENVSRK
jgi:hypothetical protein